MSARAGHHNKLARLCYAAAALFAAVLAAELAWFGLLQAGVDTGAAATADIDGSRPPQREMAARAAYEEIARRPLFNPTRRPVVYRPPETREPPLSEKWSLSAVVDTGAGVFAIFAGKQGQQRQRLQVGDSLDGWQVVRLEAGRVVLRRAGEEQVFELGIAGSGIQPPSQPDDAAKQGGGAPPAATTR